MINDFLYRGVIDEKAVRFVYCLTTRLANEAVHVHELGPVGAHVFCRALTAGVLTVPLLEGDEHYTLRWKYEGVIKSLIIDVSANGNVRGMLVDQRRCETISGHDDLYGDSGMIGVVKSTSKATLNSGSVEAGLMDVVDDLAYFFSLSDQQETGMSVLIGFRPDVHDPVSLCHGIMLQALPDCDLEWFATIVDRLRAPEVRELLGKPPEPDNYVERILQCLFGEDLTRDHLTLTACAPSRYICRCSREKSQVALRTIPRDELKEILKQEEDIVISCDFCELHYRFTGDEIREIVDGGQDT
jgi:molecular chaperone Hsp33